MVNVNKEELFVKHMDQLFRMASFMLTNVQDAEDAVQETYVRLLVKAPSFSDEEHGKAWLLRVCINICKNQLRFRKRHAYYDLKEYDCVINGFEEWEVLHAITQLPIKMKEALILHAIEGYSVKETASILKTSESAIKKRLQRGREELNKQIGVKKWKI